MDMGELVTLAASAYLAIAVLLCTIAITRPEIYELVADYVDGVALSGAAMGVVFAAGAFVTRRQLVREGADVYAISEDPTSPDYSAGDTWVLDRLAAAADAPIAAGLAVAGFFMLLYVANRAGAALTRALLAKDREQRAQEEPPRKPRKPRQPRP